MFLFCHLDVSDIKFVINFDYPNCSEDYVHRIGRTARAEQSGTAYTFFTPDNSKQAKDLVEVLREAKQQINPKLQQLSDSSRDFGKGRLRFWCVLSRVGSHGVSILSIRQSDQMMISNMDMLPAVPGLICPHSVWLLFRFPCSNSCAIGANPLPALVAMLLQC